MRRRLVLCLALTASLAQAACQTTPEAEPDFNVTTMPTTGTGAGAQVHLLDIERAYTLEDPRELDFKARIAAEAAQYCGTARHTIQSTRPYGPERIGEDFLYRMVEVGITCAP